MLFFVRFSNQWQVELTCTCPACGKKALGLFFQMLQCQLYVGEILVVFECEAHAGQRAGGRSRAPKLLVPLQGQHTSGL